MIRAIHHQKKYNDLKISKANFFAQFIVVTAFILFILPVNTNAQNNNLIHSKASLAEKVYLQLDSKVYTTGNIVWFKSVVLSAYNHVPSSLSGVLHVELIKSDETILEKKLIKLENGIGQGFFYLNNNLSEGLYLIRAYTQWNKNFDTNFFFEEYIHVFPPKKEGEEEKPISSIQLIKELTKENRLEASFNPLVIDSLHKNKLQVIITLDDKKDTLLVKRGKNKKYLVDYTIPSESQFATLQMQTENGQKYSKTVVLNKDYLDLQFFPESGELVHGLKNKLGFKALDANGQGKIVQGDIIDENDTVITSFKSNRLGMGSFVLNKVDSTKTYYARLMSQSAEKETLLYPLPYVAHTGTILSVEKRGRHILLSTFSNDQKNDSISLNISSRGVSVFNTKASLKEGVFILKIPRNSLPEGIVSCKILNNSMHPIAERLYFNERPEGKINITLSTNKDIYSKRELTDLKIATTNSNGEPIHTDVSLLVINKQQMGKMQHTRQNIYSYFLLNSELKGKIENPGFYFRKDSSTFSDLDALMLTQGWTKYNYSKPFTVLPFLPEQNLSVSGYVNGLFSKKKKKEVALTMMTFGKKKSVYKQIADSIGKFKFNLNDEYGQNVNVLIQSAKKSGKKVDYTIKIDEKKSPSISFNHVKTIEKLDSVVNNFVEKNIERKNIDDAFTLQSDDIFLEEVEVTGYRLTPNRKKVMKEYGKPTDVIDGKKIQEKEKKWSYGLYSVLLFNFPDKVRITRKSDGNLYADINNSEPTLVVVDGIPVQLWEYPLIPNIPPSEVSSFEIIEYAKNFPRLYCEVYPMKCKEFLLVPEAVWGNVIAIYTHKQKGIVGIKKPVGLMEASVPVFSEPREFYAPKHENIQPNDWRVPDLRALVHWEPIQKTDNLGNVSASFYNADNIGEMIVVVEAISANGEIGYQEIDYEIEGE